MADVDILIDESFLYTTPDLTNTLANLNLTLADTDLPFIANEKIFREDMVQAGYCK